MYGRLGRGVCCSGRGLLKTFRFGINLSRHLLATQIPRKLCASRFALCLRYANSPFRKAKGSSSPLTVAKNKGHPQRVSLFFWRRKRDSNPRAFWANGFQDRLVVTASIFLRIKFLLDIALDVRCLVFFARAKKSVFSRGFGLFASA